MFTLDFFLIYKGITATNTSDPRALTGEIVFYAFGSLLIGIMAFGIYKENRFAIAPAILTNLIAIGISWYMFSAGLFLPSAILATVGIATILLLGSIAAHSEL